MSNDNGGGMWGCMLTILFCLVIGAAFGLVEWNTVGSFARVLVYGLIALVIVVIVFSGFFFGGDDK